MVSIITPVYNSEKLIGKTIECVLNQTYQNWEMLLVDDCSTDKSASIIKKYSKKDSRIKYIKLKENSGAAKARNKALEESKGRFIAYLDADDLWKPQKLEKQIEFMKKNKYGFTCTDYEKIDEDGKSLNKIVKIPNKVNYNLFLRNTIIQTVGVMIDTKITGKELLVMPNIRRRQDAATWCQLLKNGFDCYEVPENLSYYRVVSNSLSSNKLKAVKGTWNLYRNIEKLSLLKSCYCFIGYAFNAVKKRIYIKKSNEINFMRIGRKIIAKINPVILNKLMYRVLLKKRMNLKQPTTFNEKINWLKMYVYPKDKIYSDYADKYKLHLILKQLKLSKYSVKLLGAWNNPKNIDWDKLPTQFVLKCNHGSKYNIICKDKYTFDKEAAIKKLSKWFKEDFGLVSGELHYSNINRKIICEEFLGDNLKDFQIWCSHGQILFTVYIDSPHGVNRKVTYDENWNRLNFVTSLPKIEQEIPKPKKFNEMIKIAKMVSKKFVFLRLDFYIMNNNDVKISEMTFSPASGFVSWNPEKMDIEIGKRINLNNIKK